MHQFHWLEKLDFDGEELVVHLAELLRGQPDGLLGHPLEVRADSARYRVHFRSVGAFKTLPEMFNELSEAANKLEPFLFQESESAYATEMKDAMELARPIPSGSLQHYVVYAENVVTHVLASAGPQVSRI